jgi:hypothetical protein
MGITALPEIAGRKLVSQSILAAERHLIALRRGVKDAMVVFDTTGNAVRVQEMVIEKLYRVLETGEKQPLEPETWESVMRRRI